MFRQDIYKMKKTGRVCYPFPWESTKEPQPWKHGYQRVIIPLTAEEKKHSSKLIHMQIVRNDNLVKVQESRMALH